MSSKPPAFCITFAEPKGIYLYRSRRDRARPARSSGVVIRTSRRCAREAEGPHCGAVRRRLSSNAGGCAPQSMVGSLHKFRGGVLVESRRDEFAETRGR